MFCTGQLTDTWRNDLEACRQIPEPVEADKWATSGALSTVRGRPGAAAAPVVFGRLHVVPLTVAFIERQPEVGASARRRTAT